MERRAFTLIELVLSMALLSLLLLVALSSLHLGTRLWESGSRTAEHGWVKRYFTSVFQAEAASAFPYVSGEKIVFSGSHEKLEFVTTSNALSSIPWGGAKLVQYAVEDGCLVVKEKTLPQAQEDFNKITELSREVEKIRFAFLGSAGWEDEWDGTGKDSLPLAIKAAVIFKDEKDEAEFSAPVMLRVREKDDKTRP